MTPQENLLMKINSEIDVSECSHESSFVVLSDLIKSATVVFCTNMDSLSPLIITSVAWEITS